MQPIQHPDLQLDEHLRLQHLLFVLRRIGTALLLAGVVAALCGLLGGTGPMARTQAAAGPLTVDYPRFTRYQMPTRLAFEVITSAASADTFDIVIEGDHARDFSFEYVLPQPAATAVADDRVRYTFNVEPGGQQLVVIRGQPEAIGRLTGSVSVGGQVPVRIDSFVYP